MESPLHVMRKFPLRVMRTGRFETGLDAAEFLVMRGRLRDVPAVLAFYHRHRAHKDADIVPTWFDYWLARPDESFRELDPFAEADEGWVDYRRQIGQRFFALCRELGTSNVRVHRGQVYDLERIARQMRDDLGRGLLSRRDVVLFCGARGRHRQ